MILYIHVLVEQALQRLASNERTRSMIATLSRHLTLTNDLRKRFKKSLVALSRCADPRRHSFTIFDVGRSPMSNQPR